MSLEDGKVKLEEDLYQMYVDIGEYKSVDTFAKRKAQAIYDFAKTGIPMTILTNAPGAVVGYVTQTPVQAVGLGGFDSSAPGMGLAEAKVIFQTDYVTMWTHGGANITARIYAKKHAEIIYKYYKEAKILTIDISVGLLPAPPPVGPVTGPMIGTGGDLTSIQGIGFDAAKPILEAELIRIWSQISYENYHTVPQFALEMADAIHKFCIEGQVNTTGVIIAPAGVSPKSGSGGYFVGTGTAVGTIS
jgi:hypothetical protein